MLCKIIVDINDAVKVEENARHYDEGWCVSIQLDSGDKIEVFFCAEHKRAFEKILG